MAQQALAIQTPEQVTQQIAEEDRKRVSRTRAVEDSLSEATAMGLSSYIRNQFDLMRQHRSSQAGWNDRLLAAQRAFNGTYDPAKEAEIRQFGGSEIYARVTSSKCRGAYAMLRDVYLGPEKSWGIDPTPEPTLPDDIRAEISMLVEAEVRQSQSEGLQLDQRAIQDRINKLVDAANRANLKKAREEAAKSERRIDDLLTEGGFYSALSEFLFDIPMFPYAVMKGPVVRIVQSLTWENGQATMQQKPRLFWNRVSPFDIYWTPGVASIADANIIERLSLTRAAINDLLDLPGYNSENVRAVLREYGDGFREFDDYVDSERAHNESRENPHWNRSGMIDCLEFHGNISGKMLLEYGMSPKSVPDAERDYFVQIWMIGRYVVKCQLHPSPRKRHPYYVSSFEKIPGTPVGNCLTDILSDVQDVCNSALRALVNNMSMSSGPMVQVNMDRLHGASDVSVMHPWKIWQVVDDPLSAAGTQSRPIEFFQPSSNAQELLGVYEKFTQIGDEMSAIPRYMSGSEKAGGAARTSSGLAMLMGNAGKVLQTVAANIDRDVMEPLLIALYDMIMLTDETGILRGDERVSVRGVNVVVQRETNRQRQIEFLQSTANPIDMEIIGAPGRASLLRSVADDLGLEGAEIVPSEEDIAAKVRMAEEQQAAMMAAQQGMAPPGNGPGPGGGPPQKKPGTGAPGVDDANAMRGMA